MKAGKLIVLGLAAIMAVSSCKKPVASAKLKTEADSVSYCMGLSIGKNLKEGKVKEINSKLMAKAIDQVLKGDSVMFNDAKINEIMQTYFMKLRKAEMDKNLKEGQAFLAKNKSNSGIVVLPSGLQYQVLKTGNGATPTATDMVAVQYVGSTIDGKVFDKQEGKDTAKFEVGKVIPGWTEALEKMTVGSRWKLFVPSTLAYGENGAGRVIPPNATLIFEVELIGITKQAPKPEAKQDAKMNSRKK
jgi:FKBP-type peptidyl-prolyl cis-trans isomerase FklB